MIRCLQPTDPAHLSLLQQAAQRPLPPDPSSPQQHKDYQRHHDSYQERPDDGRRQRGLADRPVRAGDQEERVKIPVTSTSFHFLTLTFTRHRMLN